MILGRESGGWATHGRVFCFQRQLAGYDPSDLKFDDAAVLSQTDFFRSSCTIYYSPFHWQPAGKQNPEVLISLKAIVLLVGKGLEMFLEATSTASHSL